MSSGVATPMARQQRVDVVADQVGHRAGRRRRAVAPGDRRSCAGCRLIEPSSTMPAASATRSASTRLNASSDSGAGRPQQHPQRLAAQEAPAEDVVLALPGGQRLVRLQIVHPGRVAAARGQQPLAQHARLHRAHGPHPRLPARDSDRRARAASDRRAAPSSALSRGTTAAAPPSGPPSPACAAIDLVEPGGVLQRLLVFAARAIAIQVDDVARPLLQALAIDRVDAGLARGRTRPPPRAPPAPTATAGCRTPPGNCARRVGPRRRPHPADRWPARRTSRGRRSASRPRPRRPAG